MRAKYIAWILAVLLIAAVAMLVVRRTPSMSLSEVNSGIEKLKTAPDIEFTGSKEYAWKPHLKAGRLDELRNLLRLPKKNHPLKAQILSFRDSKGRFFVHYFTSRDGMFRVEVFTDSRFEGPSPATMDLVRKCLPTARVSKVKLP